MEESIAKFVDYTFLKPSGPAGAVETLCAEAAAAGCAAVCVNPAETALAARLLRSSPVKVCTVVDFPLGQGTAAMKRASALDSIGNGADELDVVLNRRLLRRGAAECEAGLAPFASVRRETDRPVVLKLILECCDLERGEIVAACGIARRLGFDFVKTSTGFGAGGATVEDVRLMRSAAGPEMGVKAAGGIRTFADASAMLAAGATRIGASAKVWLRP